MGAFKDLTGKKFGELTVIEKGKKTNSGTYYWKCRCNCSNEIYVLNYRLTKGDTKDCGHNEKERKIKWGKNRFRDLTNKRFGKLIALETFGKTKNGKYYWYCKCDCGNYTKVLSGDLIEHNTKSCGCITSNGNNEIEKILNNLNIKFEREKRFSNCRNKKPLAFDFYLSDYKLCIEYQGKQHYEQRGWGNKNERQKLLEETQKHDKIKQNYCKQYNIKLLEIKYINYSKIEDILKKELNIND